MHSGEECLTSLAQGYPMRFEQPIDKVCHPGPPRATVRIRFVFGFICGGERRRAADSSPIRQRNPSPKTGGYCAEIARSSSVLDIECVAERVIESDPRSDVEVPDRFGVKECHRDGYQVVAADHAWRG
jgi:hypothetical protein